MTAHYTCTLFKLLYRRYKLTVVACRGLKRSLWPGWVRSRPFTCSSLFKAISPTLDFCNSKLGSCAFYVDFITVAILCFLTSEFSSVSCKEETVAREGKTLDVLKVIYSPLLAQNREAS